MRNPGNQLAVIAAGTYATSFFLPVMDVFDTTALGWSAFVVSINIPAYWPMWLANPAFLFGLVYCWRGRWRRARNLAVLAMSLGLSEVWFFWGQVDVAYAVWLLSMLFLFIAGHQ